MTVKSIKYKIDSIKDLFGIAEKFLVDWEGEKLFALKGEMGAGKTTFVKAVCDVLGVEDSVSSPTFSIVNEYTTANGDILYHFDFYRIEDMQEAIDFGIEEYLYSNELCFMEWPERVENILPAEVVQVQILETSAGKREIIATEYSKL